MTAATAPALIETRLATEADRPALLAFIRDHWSERHVFCHAPEVFDWQYLQADKRLNMVMAASGDTVLGVLGFIPMGRFDAALGDSDVLLALWKVRDDLAPPGLGLRLLKLIQSQLRPGLIGAIGTSDMVGPIYRALGYTLGRLQQAAIFTPAAKGRLAIARGVPNEAFLPARSLAPGWRLAPVEGEILTTAEAAAIATLSEASTPRKSLAYVEERYLGHPFYAYRMALVLQDDRPHALLVWRRVACNGSHILRIVDIVGNTDWLAQGQALLRPLLESSGAEYIDLMQYGSAEAVLQVGGWFSPDWTPGLILPNYFAPFVAENVSIALAFRRFGPVSADAPPVRLYRADSDQDRPNQAPVIPEPRS